MELWPRKKREKKPERKLELESLFDSPGLTSSERTGHCSTLEQVQTPEDFLNIVDFDTLNDIFDDLQRKSGGPAELSNTGHRVLRDKITFHRPATLDDEKETTYGASFVAGGEIFLRWTDENISSTVRGLQLLHVLSHESTHVRGGYKAERFEKEGAKEGDWVTGFNTRIGLEETIQDTQEQNFCSGTGLNEAVTEKIGLEVFIEYLRRTGYSGHLDSVDTIRMIDKAAYAKERLVLEYMLEKLATASEVPLDTVWRGIVRAYMSGNQELEELMNEAYRASEDNQKIQTLLFQLKREQLPNIPFTVILDAVHTPSPDTEYSSRSEALSELTVIFERRKFIDRALRILELKGPQNDLKLR